MLDVPTLKAQVRSILLALGRGATEREFRKEYYEIEGQSFNNVIRECGFRSIVDFLMAIPDVCRISYTFEDELFIQRVSSEETRHMDRLTIVKKRKRKAKTSSFRPVNRFNTSFARNAPSFRPPQSYNYTPNRSPYNQPPPRPYSSTNVLRPMPTNYQNYCPPPQTKFRPIPIQRTPGPPSPLVKSVIQKAPVRPSPPKPTVRSVIVRPPPVINEIPLHMRHNVEKVVYKKPVQPPEESKSVEALPVAPAASSSSLVSEEVVHKRIERTVSEGENEIPQEVIEISSDTEYESGSSCTEISSDYLEEIENAVVNDARKVDYDEASEAKITITINRTPPRTRKTPHDIRAELTALRSRFANLEITKEVVSEGFDLSDYITSADFQLPKPKLEQNPPWFDIKILGAESPEKFTFQFDFPAIEELQNGMREFYESLADIGTYIVKKMAKDMIVSVLHSNRWYRAKIIDFDGTTAQVIPLDCLTLKAKTIPRTDVYYLHKKFTELSQKSGYGKIFGIMPVNGEKNEEVTAEIAKLKPEKRQATVKKVENDFYSLSIIADNKTRFRIIDILIEKSLINLDVGCFRSPAMNTHMSLK